MSLSRIREVALEDISIPRGRRPLGVLDDLTMSIREVGLLQPIVLTKDLRLVAGLHRLRAVQALGWARIPASILSIGDLARDAAELDENLVRRELTELERALALRRRKQIHVALHPETRPVTERGGPGRGGKTGAKTAVVLPFAKEAARKTGYSPRTINRSIAIAEALDPQAARMLTGSWIADSQTELLRIGRLDPSMQRRVAESIARGDATYVKDALRKVRWAETDEASGSVSRARQATIYEGDFALAAKKVKPGTVDLLLTDVPWDRRSMARYGELAALVAELLAPTGTAVVIVGQQHMPAMLAAFHGKLTYRWTLCLHHPTRGKQAWTGGVISSWTPALVFTRGTTRAKEFFGDVITDGPATNASDTRREWEKGERGAVELIDRYTTPGQLVLDPFSGSGTTGVAARKLGRRFFGFDCDAAAVKLARSRIAAAPWADPAAVPTRKRQTGFPA